MSDEIVDIVNTVKNKEEEGEQKLLTYLDSLDLHTLNRLLIIFNGPGKPTLLQVFTASTGSTALIGGVIAGSFLSGDSPLFSIFICMVLVLSSFYFVARLKLKSQQNAIIKDSTMVVSTQKILTSINFVIQEKYRALI